ncbi:MAG: hypothetical protein ACJAVA_000202 [Flavobacteriaceae bacterium]|jgi:hypothetical protein
MKDENLQEDGLGYIYYEHSQFPLRIVIEKSTKIIKVEVIKYYKGQEMKKLTKQSKILNTMSKEQVEDYILDVVYLFLDGKKDK